MNELLKRKQKKLGYMACMIFILCCLVLSSGANAQGQSNAEKIKVTGKVVDQAGELLFGVNVTQKGTTNGAATDADGNFTLSVPRGAVIVFNYIGFNPTEIVANSETPITVTLNEDVQKL